MTFTDSDVAFMREALDLAQKGLSYVAPNPLVGCVIVSAHGEIIGRGWHEHFGQPHAEVNAFHSVKTEHRVLLAESTWYVTLEPCNHIGKTPACAELLLQIRPKRVVIGCPDSNPKVQGGGAERLKQAGIIVDIGCLRDAIQWQNRRFFFNGLTGKAWVLLKWATSRDGYLDPREAPDRIPGSGGRAVTGALARTTTHRWRSWEQAIAIGAHTAIVDEPSLTVRDVPGPSPRPIILDPEGLLLPDHPLLLNRTDTLLVLGQGKKSTYPTLCHWDLAEGLDTLRSRLFQDFGISSVMVEGGATVLSAFLASDEWDELRVWTGNCTFGSGLPAPSIPPLTTTPPEFVEANGNAGDDEWIHRVNAKHSGSFGLVLPSRP